MTYNYPFFTFPHFRRYSSYYPAHYVSSNYNYVNNNGNLNFKNEDVKSQKKEYRRTPNNTFAPMSSIHSNDNKQKEENRSKKTSNGFSFLSNFLHQDDRSEDEEYFNLFGIRLYNDDLLLIGLIFFLYKEDVKDQYLFFALILLLLS